MSRPLYLPNGMARVTRRSRSCESMNAEAGSVSGVDMRAWSIDERRMIRLPHTTLRKWGDVSPFCDCRL